MQQILILLSLIFIGFGVRASHVSGFDIQYNHFAPKKVAVSVKMYRDCSGIRMLSDPIPIRISGCVNFYYNLKFNSKKFKHINSGDTNISKCDYYSSSNYSMGYQEFVFEDTITLPKACSSIRISHRSVCCRNLSQNTRGSVLYGYVDIKSNRKNHGPIYKQGNVNFFAAGVQEIFHAGAIDPDGDSLVYSLACPLQDSINILPFNSPYSCLSPTLNFSLDSVTGKVTFLSRITGNFQFAVVTKEYDRRTKKLLSVSHRDIQLNIALRQMKNPIVKDSLISLSLPSSFHYKGLIRNCGSNSINYKFSVIDPDSSGALRVKVDTNLYPLLKVRSFMPLATRPDSFIVELSGKLTSENFNRVNSVQIVIANSKSPVRGFIRWNIPIEVYGGPHIFRDTVLCKGQVAKLGVVNGNTIKWNVLPGGDSLKIGSLDSGKNFSCDTCFSVFAKPSKTTKYTATIDSISAKSCAISDTVTVKIVNDFSLTTSNDTTICTRDSIELFVKTNTAVQAYNWYRNNRILPDTTQKIKVRELAGYTRYKVQVKNTNGCVKYKEFGVTRKLFPTQINLNPSDSLICLSDTISLNPISRYNSLNYSDTANIDSGLKSSTFSFNLSGLSSPDFFPFDTRGFSRYWKYDLYLKASELKQAGLNAGFLKAVRLTIVDTLGKRDSVLNNLTLKMGYMNPNKTSRPINEDHNFRVLFNDSLHLKKHIIGNQLIIEFNQAYRWDGKNDLVLSFCCENQSTLGIKFEHEKYLKSHHRYRYSTSPLCIDPNTIKSSAAIPRLLFDVVSFDQAAQLQYKWSLASGTLLDSLKSKKQRAVLDTNYKNDLKLQVSLKSGLCKDSFLAPIKVVKQFDTKPILIKNAYCKSDAPFIIKTNTPYSVATPGGKWSGVGIIDDTLGVWDPRLSGDGSFAVKYEVKGSKCDNSDTSTVVIGKPFVANLLSRGPFCMSTKTVKLKAQIPGGVFYGKGVDSNSGILNLDTALFKPIGNSYDSVNIGYKLIQKGCVSSQLITAKIYNGLDTNILNPKRSFCIDEPSVLFNNKFNSGAWLGSGISPAGRFSPSVADTGIHTLKLSYAGICPDSHSIVVSVHPLPKTKIDFIPGFNVPIANKPYKLTGTPSGGIWHAPYLKIFNDTAGTFNPSKYAGGKYAVSYTVTTNKGCSKSDTSIVYICNSSMPKPVVSSPRANVYSCNTNGSRYEWYCNDTLLNLATKQIFSSKKGTYKVIVYHGVCKSAVSSPFSLTPNGLVGLRQGQVKVFPNPIQVGQTLLVELKDLPNNTVQLHLLTSDGKSVATEQFVEKVAQIKTNNLVSKPGLYVLKITQNQSVIYQQPLIIVK